MTRVMLGLRLAARAGRARMFAVVGCSALGILLLLLCLDFPDVAQKPNDFTDPSGHTAYRVLTAIVALPVVILIAATSRLSSDTRDRRLSTLRLLGLPPRGTGTVAALETGFLVLLGSILGAFLHSAVRAPVWKSALRHGLGYQLPHTHVTRDASVVIITALLVAIVATAPARRVGSTLLQSARSTRRSRLINIFALIGLVGFIAAAILAALPAGPPNQAVTSRVPYMGFALICLIIGILGLTTTVCSLLANTLKRSSSPATLIAAARTESDRASLGRAFAGLGAATFTAAFGLSVFTIFTTTPQYRSAAYWHSHETASLYVADDAHTSQLPRLAAQLKSSPGVVSQSAATLIDSSGQGYYTVVISLSCQQIRTQASVNRCSDTQPWVGRVGAADDGSQGISGGMAGTQTSSTKNTVTIGKRHLPVSPAFEAPVTLKDTTPDATIRSLLSDHTLILPPSWLKAHGVQPNALFVTVKPGARVAENDTSILSNFMVQGLPDTETWDEVEGYRHLAYLLIAVVMSVGLLTVIVSVLDLLAERRRRVASLRMMGIPTSTLRSAQFLSTLVPMAATLIVTLAAGYLMGRAYLNFAGEAGSTPTVQLSELLGIMLLFGIALAAATTSGLGRPLTANLIRRE